MTTAMENQSSILKQRYHKKSTNNHRHIMCLYGDDEKLIRITAMQLNMTVSHLIRLALYLYISTVEQRTFEWRFIYYYGTRITRKIGIIRINHLDFPMVDTFFHEKWPRRSWWRRPRGKIIQIPYSNETNAT